jgi:hypothetical protein
MLIPDPGSPPADPMLMDGQVPVDDGMTALLNAPPAPPMGMPQQPVQQLPPEWNPDMVASKWDLRVKLDREERDELGEWLSSETFAFLEAWDDRRASAQIWRDAANMMPNWPVTDPRGGGDQSNQTLWMSRCRYPGSAVACLSQQQSLTQQLLTPNPAFTAIPQQIMWSPDGGTTTYNLVEWAPDVSRALQSLLDRSGWKQRVQDLFREIMQVCPAALHVMRDKDCVYVMEPEGRQDEAQLGEDLEAGVMSPVEAYEASIETNADGTPRVRRGWREEVLKDGVEWRVVEAERFIRFPAGARYEDDTFAMGELITLTARGLKKKLDEPLSGFYPDAVEELLDTPSDDLENDDLRAMWDREGYQNPGTPTVDDKKEYRQWVGVELEIRGHLDGDLKREKRYLVTYHPGTKKILRLVYVSDKHGYCNYVPVNFMGAKLVGMSLCELNAVLQDSADKILGDTHDLLSILTACGGSLLAEESAVPDWDQVVFVPGKVIPVQRINGIMPVPMDRNIPAAIQQNVALLGMLWDLMQKLTATSNISLGQESERDQTATEATMLFRQDAAIRETNALGVALSLGKAAKLTAMLEAQCCKDPEYKWIEKAEQGQTERTIDPRLLGAPYEWICSGITGSSNPQVRYQKAITVQALVQQTPFLGQVPEIQEEALVEVLQALDVQDVREWMAKAKAYQEQIAMANQMAAQAMAAREQQSQQQQLAAGDEMAAANAELGIEAIKAAGKGGGEKNGQNNGAAALMQVAQASGMPNGRG